MAWILDIGKFLVQFIPMIGPFAGPALDAGETVLGNVNRQQKAARRASEYLDYLDEYIRLTTVWCLLSQMTLDSLDAISGSGSLSLKAAEERVQGRFESLVTQRGAQADSAEA